MSAPTMKSLEGRIELLGTALDHANDLIIALQQQINAHMSAINALSEKNDALQAQINALSTKSNAPRTESKPAAPRAEWEIISKYAKRDGTKWLKVFRSIGRTSDHQVTEAAYNAWTPGTTGVGLVQSMLAVKQAA